MAVAKKWMVVVSDAQYEWIKEVAEKADVSGAAVLRALISQGMEQNSSDFRRGLMSQQLKADLQALEEKKAVLAEKEKELRMKLSGRDGRVPA